MARKRAPGGGRKPIGAFPASTQLSIRMPDNIRVELEAAAKKRGWSLTQELLWRLRVSLSRGREDRRDAALRAIFFLITQMATQSLYTDTRGRGKPWYQDPFTFRAFKLAVAKLLDGLEPRGEISIPLYEIGSELAGHPIYSRLAGQPIYSTLIKTPEDAAEYAAEWELHKLFHSIVEPVTPDLREWMRTKLVSSEAELDEHIDYRMRELYAFSDARRDLGIKEPQKPKS
jgi:hypothetical protein